MLASIAGEASPGFNSFPTLRWKRIEAGRTRPSNQIEAADFIAFFLMKEDSFRLQFGFDCKTN
jgi:hypothetical protein